VVQWIAANSGADLHAEPPPMRDIVATAMPPIARPAERCRIELAAVKRELAAGRVQVGQQDIPTCWGLAEEVRAMAEPNIQIGDNPDD
jgi:hypothetical protein